MIKAKLRPYYIKFKVGKAKTSDYLFGHRKYRKFIIISDARTGSTLLKNLLNFHPQIIAEGEIFKYQNGKSSEKIWNELFRKRSKRSIYVGCKLFYYHPAVGDKRVWEILKNDRSVIIIHLTRENILRSLVSKKIGLKTKMWTENIHSKEIIPLEEKRCFLNPLECEKYFEEISAWQQKTEKDFKDHEMISVTYEDLAENRMRVLQRIAALWDLESFKKDSELKKQNPESLEDLIMNYNDLEEYFAGTEWEKFFTKKFNHGINS